MEMEVGHGRKTIVKDKVDGEAEVEILPRAGGFQLIHVDNWRMTLSMNMSSASAVPDVNARAAWLV